MLNASDFRVNKFYTCCTALNFFSHSLSILHGHEVHPMNGANQQFYCSMDCCTHVPWCTWEIAKFWMASLAFSQVYNQITCVTSSFEKKQVRSVSAIHLDHWAYSLYKIKIKMSVDPNRQTPHQALYAIHQVNGNDRCFWDLTPVCKRDRRDDLTMTYWDRLQNYTQLI